MPAASPSRAERAGAALGESSIATVDLLYQNHTATTFMRGLLGALQKHPWSPRRTRSTGTRGGDRTPDTRRSQPRNSHTPPRKRR